MKTLIVAPERRAPVMREAWFNSSLTMRHPWKKERREGGREGGRKEGRKEGREGREEGREGGGEGGREGGRGGREGEEGGYKIRVYFVTLLSTSHTFVTGSDHTQISYHPQMGSDISLI